MLQGLGCTLVWLPFFNLVASFEVVSVQFRIRESRHAQPSTVWPRIDALIGLSCDTHVAFNENTNRTNSYPVFRRFWNGRSPGYQILYHTRVWHTNNRTSANVVDLRMTTPATLNTACNRADGSLFECSYSREIAKKPLSRFHVVATQQRRKNVAVPRDDFRNGQILCRESFPIVVCSVDQTQRFVHLAHESSTKPSPSHVLHPLNLSYHPHSTFLRTKCVRQQLSNCPRMVQSEYRSLN